MSWQSSPESASLASSTEVRPGEVWKLVCDDATMTTDGEPPSSDHAARLPTVSEALQTWRDAERHSIRSTAQREAAEEAIEAAQLAEVAATATSAAAASAQRAAGEASRAAEATAEAARRVVTSTLAAGEAKRLDEQTAISAEDTARDGHQAAVQRADERYRRS